MSNTVKDLGNAALFAKDMQEVFSDLQIGYEKITYPALAEVHADELGARLRSDAALTNIASAADSLYNNTAAIIKQKQYGRLLTDPVNSAIAKYSEFGEQSVAAQVDSFASGAVEGTIIGALTDGVGNAAKGIGGSHAFDSVKTKMTDFLKKHDAMRGELATAHHIPLPPEMRQLDQNILYAKGEAQRHYLGNEVRTSPDELRSTLKAVDKFEIQAINGAPREIPLGFRDRAQFLAAVNELDEALKLSGIDDAPTIGVRGSSITGVSFKTGRRFHNGSDLDFFVESSKWPSSFRTSDTIDGMISDKLILAKYPRIEEWSDKWSAILNRRKPLMPAGFRTGKIPDHPAVILERI